MPQFHYTAKSRDGKRVEGFVEASDRRAALSAVRNLGFLPLAVTQGGAPAGKFSGNGKKGLFSARSAAPKKPSGLSRPFYMSPRERLLFTGELADLLEGGMTLGNALNALARRGEDGSGKSQIIVALRDAIIGGESFSAALNKFPKVFTPVYVNMIRAGEASGAMVDVLRRLAAYDERNRAMHSKITSAMVYPCIVLAMGVIVMIFVMTVILPKFTVMFEQMGPDGLPPATRLLLGINDWLLAYWPILLVFLVGGTAGFIHWKKTPRGNILWDRFKLRAPLIRGIVASSVYANFASTLESLLRNGVPILQALQITSQTVGNVVIGEELKKARDRVTDGTSISGPLEQGGAFPPTVIDMLSIGERTGDMPSALAHISKRFDTELEKNITVFTTALEPIMIFLVAIVIGFIAIAIMQAVMTVTSGASLQ